MTKEQEQEFAAGADAATTAMQGLVTMMARQLGPQVVMVALHAQEGYMAASLLQTWRHHKGQPELSLDEFSTFAGEVNEKVARYIATLLSEAGVDVIVQSME